MNLVVVLGNQLFDPKLLQENGAAPGQVSIYMREDRELCTYFRFHKHKIVFFLAAMREYRAELNSNGYKVHYEELDASGSRSYESSLLEFVKKNGVKKVSLFEIEDKFFESRLFAALEKAGLAVEVWRSPMFLTSRDQFRAYLSKNRRPFMKTFYEAQRRRLNVLVKDGEPVGGEWSFDKENRKALPAKHMPPPLPSIVPSKITQDVAALTERYFPDHPGDSKDFWLPVDREGAKNWLRVFFAERLHEFGPYEDAIPAHSAFLYHSVLTPFLNAGLLTPREVVSECLKHASKAEIPLPSLEGFIRQVIGWREFVRGIYREFSEEQDEANYWQHKNKLSEVWYGGKSGVPALDRALERVWKRGYLHHIERLMVIGSLMVLLEVDPREGHRWFMEMFIDSSDWVMGPNVYGMALFSDGGIFATKPYICGSNYLRKMSGDKDGDWCDGVDGLYWTFIRKHKEKFSRNPRLSMMARALDKIAPERMKTIEAAAEALRAKLIVKA